MSIKPSLKNCQENPSTLGYMTLGPLFLGTALFILKTAQERGYKKLFFVSRDGYYMKVAYDLLVQGNESAPSSHYLLSSRKIANDSSCINDADLIRIADIPHKPSTIKSLLINRFNLSEDECKLFAPEIFDRKGFESIDAIVDESNHPNFVALIRDLPQSQKDSIFNKSRSLQEIYLNYLEDIGLTEPNSCIVDIGYSGTLQSILSKLTQTSIGGIYFITWEKSKRLDEEKLVYDSFLGHKVPQTHIFNRYIQLFELVFSATHPSIIGMKKNIDDCLDCVYDSNILPQENLLSLALLRKGAIEFITDLIPKIKNQYDTFDSYQPANWTEPVFAFFANPSIAGAYHFKNIIFEDLYGGEGNYLCIQPNDIRAFSKFDALSKSLWLEGTESLYNETIHARNNLAAFEDTELFLQNGIAYSQVDLFQGNTLYPAYLRLNCHSKAYGYDIAKKTPFKKEINICVVSIFHDATVKFLPVLMESLSKQIFKSWNFIVVDATTSGNLKDEMLHWQYICPEIKIVAATPIIAGEKLIQDFFNQEEIIIFAPPGSIPYSNLIAEFILPFVKDDKIELVYSDHMVCDQNGQLNPVFKPSWSPELIISEPYIGAIYAARSSVLKKSLRQLDISSHIYFYQHLLELSTAVTITERIPKILWERQLSWGSDEQNSSVKILSAWIKQLGIEGEAIAETHIGNDKKYVFNNILFPDMGPSVAILIPTKNKVNLLERCINSILATSYLNYKVYIIDNESDDPETLLYLNNTKHTVIKIQSPNGQFNYSYINNKAVEIVNEDYVLFLNNDTEVISSRWLSQMVGWLGFRGVASVGARLLYEDGTIQHAGLINGLLQSTLPAPAYKLLDRSDPGYLGHTLAVRNYSAMTAACMLTRRNFFLEQGGFNEEEFGVAYNDCDYGFRLTKQGYRHVYCPQAELFHYEGKTRGVGVGNDKPSEELACIKLYGNWEDPYYNPNLSTEDTKFNIAGKTVCLYKIPKIRVLFATHNLNFEGAPLILLDIAKGIHKSDEMEIIVISPIDGPLKKLYEEVGITVHIFDEFNIFSSRDIVNYDRCISKTKDFIYSLNIDVVFANTVLCWWAIDSAADISIPSVWCIHESEEPFSHFNVHGAFLKDSALRCTQYPYQIVFVSYATKKLFENIRRKNNMLVIQNGFAPTRLNRQIEGLSRQSLREKLNVKSDEVMILTVGTVCERKNQIELINGLQQLPSSLIKKVRLFIVGDRNNEYSRLLHSVIAKLPKEIINCITVIPETSDVGPYYLASDIFVLTSLLESFPVVVQEAMYFSLPMIVNPTFGIKEQVRDEVSALYYETGDINSLAKKLKRLIESKDLRSLLGQNAKTALEMLPTYDGMVSQHAEVLKEAWLSYGARESVVPQTINKKVGVH